MAISTEERTLKSALTIAGELLGHLSPACSRIELAGSIRRERPVVNDIELVAIPRVREEEQVGAQGDLFAPAPPVVLVNQLWERVEALAVQDVLVPIKPGVPDLEADSRWGEKRLAGSRYFRLYLPEARVKVDLFMADAATWGVVFAIRTGCSEFSRALVTRWTAVSGGGHSQEGRLHDAYGAALETPEEEDVFRLCRARLIPPQERRDAASLKNQLDNVRNVR